MIEECIEYATEPGQDYCNLRGQVLPVVDLAAWAWPDRPPAVSGRERLLVGVSGGADSVALLHLLCAAGKRPIGLVFQATTENKEEVRIRSLDTPWQTGKLAVASTVDDVPDSLTGSPT